MARSSLVLGVRAATGDATWYENRMWPAAYWRAWSDPLMHAIHRRVLRHVAGLAEREARLAIDRGGGQRPGSPA